MRVLWNTCWLLIGIATPIALVSLGFEAGNRTVDDIPHWAVVPGAAVALVFVVGLILASLMLITFRAWAIGAYAGSAAAVVVAIFADDRWFILGAALAVPVYMFLYGVIDGRYRTRMQHIAGDLEYMTRDAFGNE